MNRAMLIGFATFVLGCEGQVVTPEPLAPGSVMTLEAPSRETFPPVADALQVGCATLDCHGQIGRNLRLYGGRGLRLDAMDTAASGSTTDAEYDANYWSVVGLEPELLSRVLQDRGARPERLALIRKGRGEEKHKGGALMRIGDDLDRCLTSWLKGQPDLPACEKVSQAERPKLPDSAP